MHAKALIIFLFGLACLLFCVGSTVAVNEETFTENLQFRPFIDGKLLTHFTFTTKAPEASIEKNDYKLLPLAFGQIVKKFAIDELHVSFTQGRWNSEKWGPAVAPAPSGLQLYALFAPQQHSSNSSSSQHDIVRRWKGLTHTLSGLLCGSVNFLDTSKPSYASGVVAAPRHSLPAHMRRSGRRGDLFRYGLLSSELVCTENLTPFKKLLPSHGKSGLSELLNPLTLYDSHFHSMALHFYRSPNEKSVEFVQTASVVFDVSKTLSSNGASPDTRVLGNWSLKSLFDRSYLPRACSLAKESSITIHIDNTIESAAAEIDNSKETNNETSSQTHFFTTSIAFEKQQKSTTQSDSDYSSAVYRLDLIEYDQRNDSDHSLGLKFQWTNAIPASENIKVAGVRGVRFEESHGMHGRFTIHIENTANENAALVKYLDLFPAFLKVYFHSLSIRIAPIGDDQHANHKVLTPGSLNDFHYFRVSPAQEREQSSLLEFGVTLPPQSRLTITLDFDKMFLRFTEHPPDANRGFDLPGALLTYSYQTAAGDLSEFEAEEYTSSLIVMLPTPDFSMPYNVITLTSTALALFFGSVYNILIRRIGKEERESSDATAATNKQKRKRCVIQ